MVFDGRETTAWGCQRFGAFVDGVDTARRVRGVARRTRRKVKRKRRDRGRSGMTYRLVSASKARLRVDRSASEMPFRSRCMLARNAAASEASPIARVRRRAIRNYRPDERPRSETTTAATTRRLFGFSARRSLEKGEVGASARAPSADPLLDARGTRGRIAARARRARIGPSRERRVSAVSYRRTRRGRLREIVDER